MADATITRSHVAAKGSVARYLDLLTLGAAAGLILFGLLAVYTATVDPDRGGLLRAPSDLFNRQLVFALMGVAAMAVTIIVDYRFVKVYAAVAYVATLLLLVVVHTPVADTVKGSQRWISLGLFKLQPSEFSKPVLLATLAAYVAGRRGQMDFRDIVRCLALTAPMAILVFLQPDLGTALVLGSILLVVLVAANADWRHIALLVGTGVFGVALLFNVGIVHDYQANRLQAFLDPSKDPYQEGYNYRLTRQAVGNGGFAGKGILPKRNVPVLTTNLRFVREQHTDFIFTVVAEQMGFLGSVTLLCLYGIVFMRGLRAAAQARDQFGAILASGIVGYLAFQVFVNIGMNVGLLPITGIPLPFVSYGGSSLLSSALAIGLLVSVGMRRFARPLT